MQLHMVLTAPKIILPVSYRHLIHGMIYRALSVDAKLSGRLHNRGYAGGKRVFKHFTFGQLEGRYRVQEGWIIFTGKAALEIRSSDAELMELLAQQLFAGRRIWLGENSMEIANSTMTDWHLLVPDTEIRMRSPAVAHITLSDGHTRFFSPDEGAYYTALVRNAERKWSSFGGTKERFALQITPKGNEVYKKQITRFKHTCITGWQGHFRLSGMPEVVDMLYQLGLGEKSSQGFGMFDAVEKTVLTNAE
ncbi:MAG: CRISPR-associated endoribonuclease Cas6 [Aristaeellaceae bacterium]